MATSPLTVSHEIEHAPLGAYHRVLLAIVGLVVIFDGYDTFVPAYVIKGVMKPWHLTPPSAGFLVSAGLIGFMIGSLAHGPIADRIGRRRALLTGLWIAGIFSLAIALFARSYASFVVLRVLTGVGLGFLLPLATTFMTEFAPARVRNQYVLWGPALGWVAGAVLAAVAGITLTPTHGWEALFWVASLSLILTVVCHVVLPESPRYLALHGRWREVAAMLGRLNPGRAAAYRDARFAAIETAAHAGRIDALLAPRYRRNTLVIWACAFLILFDIYGLSGWIPTVMAKRGESFAVSFGFGALLQFMSLVGAFVCGAVADKRADRRVVLVAWWLLGGVSILLLGVLNSHATNVLFIACAGAFVIGGQFILNNFTAMNYDTELRATGVGWELGVGRLGGILGPYIGGVLQQALGGTIGFFVALACASFASALIFAFAEPAHAERQRPAAAREEDVALLASGAR